MSKFFQAKRIEIFVIVIIISLFGVLYAFTRTAKAPITEVQQQASQQVQQSNTVSYQGVEGKNALELLQAGHHVEVKHYSFGDQVLAIDGVMADGQVQFWEFLINGQPSSVGASSYVTKSGDMITWRVSQVTPDNE